MKRNKGSGAAFRRKRKAREEQERQNEGAIMKFLIRPDHADETDITAEVHGNDVVEEVTEIHEDEVHGDGVVDEVQLEQKIEDDVDETDPPQITGEQNSNINLKDIGLWPAMFHHGIREMIIQQGWKAVQNIDSVFKEVVRPGQITKLKGETRSLSKKMFFSNFTKRGKNLRTWMIYSPSKEAVFCFCCKLFSSENSKFCSVDGFKSWWKLNPKIQEHESSLAHENAFTQWKELEIRLFRGKVIDNEQQILVKNATDKWKQILTRLLDIITFLAKQNLALRGHRENIRVEEENENKGNFLELIQLMGKYDPVLREHLVKVKFAKYATSYFSPKIQNEFLNLLGDQVRKKVIDGVKQSKYYCIIFDSTPDISHIDQMSQVLRYVKINEKEVKVEESFIRFIEMKGKNAEQITSMILKQLEMDDINIQDCRGQAFDNAAVMAGHRSGVQTRITEVNPNIVFVPCNNHSLNLAAVHAASVVANSVTFFGTLDRLFSFFSASTHRWYILTEITGPTIKRAGETRLSSRADAVKVVHIKFTEIIAALERLMEDEENATTRSDAGLILQAMLSFSFLTFLSLWSDILPEINDSQKYLQTKGLDLQQCAIKLSALKTSLLLSRDKIVDGALAYSTEICSDMGISTERRIRKKKIMRHEESVDAALSYSAELRREMFSVIDRLVEEIASRFERLQNIAKKYIFLTPFNLLDKEYSCKIDAFDENIKREDFLIERARLQNYFAAADAEDMEGPLQVLQFIHNYNLIDSVPNIVILLRIFLTCAISVASCERSFSKLKLIKNYLRSTMSQTRLTDLAILSIERDLADTIDFDEVIHDFAKSKTRKTNL